MNEITETAPVEAAAPPVESAPDGDETFTVQPGSDAAQLFAAEKISQVIDNPEFGLSKEALNSLPNPGTPEHDHMLKLFRYD